MALISGRPATFPVLAPARAPSVMAASLSTPPAASVKKPIARVLVVEDDTDIGDLMQLALSAPSFTPRLSPAARRR